METVLAIQGAHHSYGHSGENTALADVDLTVGAGECVALLGPNGAGKTTLVNLAIGLLQGQRGELRLDGGDPRDPRSRRRLGVVQQSLGFPTTLKVGELVTGAAIRAGRTRRAVPPVLAELELTDLAGRRAAKLSGGQKQRLQLAMALVSDPVLLVLDEPTEGLDLVARKTFWRMIATRRSRGTGVLVTTHLIDEAGAVADRVLLLDHGRLVAAGTPEGLIANLPDRTVVARTRMNDAQLAHLPGVASVDREGERVRIATRSPEALLRGWLAADPELAELRIEGAGLSEAVGFLTEQARRQEVA